MSRAATVARAIDLVHACADESSNPSYAGDNLFVDTEPVRRLSRELRSREGQPRPPASAQGVESPHEWGPTPERDLDGIESLLIELGRNRDFKRARKGSGPTYAKGVSRARVLAAREALVEALADFQVRADADLAAALHTELFGCVDDYERLKAREGALDFLDLLLRARDLVRDNASVRGHFQARFRRIFVDEFQDTDPLQAELLLLLAADDPDETRWESVTPPSGEAVHRGRPETVDLPVPARRRRHVHAGLPATGRRRGDVPRTAQELPERPEYPKGDQRGVPAGDGW